MKIKVHPSLCDGHRECRRFAPDFLILDDDGHLELRLAEVPSELQHAVVLAAETCPTDAITVIHERDDREPEPDDVDPNDQTEPIRERTDDG